MAAPKIYAFDNGFVCYYRRWDDLRAEDLGMLWKQYVLNEMQARCPDLDIRYWRDKQKHEIDFVLIARGKEPIAMECKWSAKNFDPANLQIFRSRYPKGENWIVCSDIGRSFRKREKELELQFLTFEELSKKDVRHLYENSEIKWWA